MMKWMLSVALLLCISLISCSTERGRSQTREYQASKTDYPLVMESDAGTRVLANEPTRIISLSLASDEILLALMNPDDIFGVSSLATNERFSSVAASAKRVERSVPTDVEYIYRLAPDCLILASYVSEEARYALRKEIDFVYTLSSFNSIQDIEENIFTLGRIVNRQESALALITAMRRRLDALAERTKTIEEPKRVLWISTVGWTGGEGSSCDEIIQRAGARNIASELGIDGNAKMPAEMLFRAERIDAIIISETSAAETAINYFKTHPIYRDLNAVQDDRFIVIPFPLFSSMSHYIVDAIELLHRELYTDHETS